MKFYDSHALEQCVDEILCSATRYSRAWMIFCNSHATEQCVDEILWQPRARAVRGWNFVFSHAIQPCVNDILQQPRDRAVRGWNFVFSHAIQQCVNEILPCIFYILHLTWIKFDTDIFKIHSLSTFLRRGKRLSKKALLLLAFMIEFWS